MIPVDFLCFGVKLRERQMGYGVVGKKQSEVEKKC